MLSDDFHLVLSLHHVVNRVKSPRAVIPDQHGRTPAVALSQNLGATSTSAVAVELTNLFIAQVFVALSTARTTQFVTSVLLQLI